LYFSHPSKCDQETLISWIPCIRFFNILINTKINLVLCAVLDNEGHCIPKASLASTMISACDLLNYGLIHITAINK
jgi:hypothetical protein